ncbi:lysyl-tRNA synthetase [Candidatus Termititenax persephonae]|uniref:Lysine--tRNA ligase n=1 Tax=Candidatus Termititenax persephonae TaxID=2218525 RepID=A0A388TFR4_9BACT|nr:lysyl-tRNA synthetase [Candidatus Termititenax persephonae]
MTEVDINSLSEPEMRLKKMQDMRAAGDEPYKYDCERDAFIADLLQKYESLPPEGESAEAYKIAGRVVAKRGHGKASFGNILDQSGKIQYYAKMDLLGEEAYHKLLHGVDLGDIVGAEGKIFRTQRGELSIRLEKLTILTKALLPLPEKFHGLTDKETRYRQRYLDLIANPEVKNVFVRRSQILRLTRELLDKEGFIEVETPVLQMIPGGAAARPFKTFHNALAMDLYLRISLELPLKRLIVGGFEKVYEIGRVFRNEGISYKHNPEYTLMELYQAYTDCAGMLRLTERLISGVVKALTGGYKIPYGAKEIDFTTPWPRVPYGDIKDMDKFEAETVNPVFVVDFPLADSPLAKKHRAKPGLVERFELIIAGMELANAYSELNDPVDQDARFDEQVKQRAAGNLEANMKDEDYIVALQHGMPPTGGLGIGMDRLVMLLTGQESIRDVLFFPHMRELPKGQA